MCLKNVSDVQRGLALENRVHDLFKLNESKIFPVSVVSDTHLMEHGNIKVQLNDKCISLTIGDLQITSDMRVRENNSEYNFLSDMFSGLFEKLPKLMVNNKQLKLISTGFVAV